MISSNLEAYVFIHWDICRTQDGRIYYCRRSNPRIGLFPDGRLIIGYHEWPEKVKTIEQLKKILDGED